MENLAPFIIDTAVWEAMSELLIPSYSSNITHHTIVMQRQSGTEFKISALKY